MNVHLEYRTLAEIEASEELAPQDVAEIVQFANCVLAARRREIVTVGTVRHAKVARLQRYLAGVEAEWDETDDADDWNRLAEEHRRIEQKIEAELASPLSCVGVDHEQVRQWLAGRRAARQARVRAWLAQSPGPEAA